MNSRLIFLMLSFSSLIRPQANYIGGNQPNYLQNNPALITKFMEQLTGKVEEACKTIPGIGSAVLSIRQAQQAVDSLLDATNKESFAKIILFKEFANKKTRQVLYKAVFWFKTFTSNVFVAVEMLYKPEGRPSFELLSYLIDSDLTTIAKVLKEQAIDQNDIFACGDIKQIYTTRLKKVIEI